MMGVGLEPARIGLAFTAGLLGFLSPCALPMLPSYVAYYLSRDEKSSTGRRLYLALVFSLSTVGGFLTTFIGVGLVPSLAIKLVPLGEVALTPVIGVGLIAVGLLTAASDVFHLRPILNITPFSSKNFVSFYVYGVAYAFASLGCSFPVFLLVVLQSAAVESPIYSLLLFLFYGLGAGTLMVPITVATSLYRERLHWRLMKMMPYMRSLNAVVLVVAGGYMVISSFLK